MTEKFHSSLGFNILGLHQFEKKQDKYCKLHTKYMNYDNETKETCDQLTSFTSFVEVNGFSGPLIIESFRIGLPDDGDSFCCGVCSCVLTFSACC